MHLNYNGGIEEDDESYYDGALNFYQRSLAKGAFESVSQSQKESITQHDANINQITPSDSNQPGGSEYLIIEERP